jgi:hypothetical protein
MDMLVVSCFREMEWLAVLISAYLDYGWLKMMVVDGEFSFTFYDHFAYGLDQGTQGRQWVPL